MAVETEGKIVIKGDKSPGLTVHIVAGDDHLTLFVADDVLADYEIPDLRISALSEGFAIRAAGEDFVLTAEDDVALAQEFGVAAAAPRLARRMATAHNTPVVPREEPTPEQRSQIGAAVFGVAGLLVVGGGTMFQLTASQSEIIGDPWLVFVVSGASMILVAWLMTMDARWPIWAAFALVLGVAVVFALGIPGSADDGARITAYGFVAAGLVLGMAAAVTAHSNH